jgi:hypothetical protein
VQHGGRSRSSQMLVLPQAGSFGVIEHGVPRPEGQRVEFDWVTLLLVRCVQKDDILVSCPGRRRIR